MPRMEETRDEVFCEAVEDMLSYIGEDIERDGLRETPRRVLRAWKEMFSGYSKDLREILKTFEDPGTDEIIAVRDISFTSTCEHHLLPFIGVVHVGYIPNGRIVGLSKVPRLVDVFAKRLQVQERMTKEIAHALEKGLSYQFESESTEDDPGGVVSTIAPHGVAVIVSAQHHCLACRGANRPEARMVTSCMLGAFKDDPSTKNEFLTLIGGSL